MEAAGLAVGVAGLAGLFSTCYQLFELFEMGSNHGKDYESFLCKLRVEKVRFLLWGEGAGVWKLGEQALATQTHENLQIPVVMDTVITIFSAIRAAFIETTMLIDRYTLQPTEANGLLTEWSAQPTDITAAVESGYLDFLCKIKATQEGARFSRKLRWALRDKKLADDLISTIHGFNDSLKDIVPINGRRQLPIQYLGNPQTNSSPTPLTRTNRSPESSSVAQPLTPDMPNTGSEYMMAGAEQRGPENHREYPPNCIRRITRELESFQCLQINSFSLSPMDDSNITICRASIEGPESTPYSNGIFHFIVAYPRDFPFKPPTIKFLTKIYHLNVNYNTGELCLEKNMKGSWSPVMTTLELLQQIQNLLVSPNIDEPFLLDVATLFKGDRQGYEKVARFYTETHAQPVKEGSK